MCIKMFIKFKILKIMLLVIVVINIFLGNIFYENFIWFKLNNVIVRKYYLEDLINFEIFCIDFI